MSRFKHLVFALVTSLIIAGSAVAQVSRGTITGIVTDPSGAVVPGVAIKVTNRATGVTNMVTTNRSGAYTVPLLPTGKYSLTAQQKGFKTYSRTDISVPVGETVRVDVSLTVGAATEKVTVTAPAPLLKRDTSDLGTAINNQLVTQLPLTSFGDQRTPATFIQLMPGTTGRGPSQNNFAGMSRTMSTSVSGSIVSSTSLMLDGADIPTSAGFEGDLRALQIPPDAIQEFKLEEITAPAEYGRSAGGVASFVMKSGTNQIHGTAYEFLRNQGLNARNFFLPAVTPYHQNEFGVNAGGPIKKNKAFIFGYYDGFRLSEGTATGLATVPTTAMKNGDFTDFGTTSNGVFTQTPLYDPTTKTTCGPEICNNIVSQSAFSPVSSKILPLFPTPSVTSPSAVVNNFQATVVNPESINEWGLHGDYNVNEKNRLSVEWDWGKLSSPNNSFIPAPLSGGGIPSINLTRNARINYNLILTPTLINEATLGWNSWDEGNYSVSSYGGRSNWDQYLGLKGFAPNVGSEFPQIVIDNYSYNGGGGASISAQHYTSLNDSLTWIKGKHTAKFGFEYIKGAQNSLSYGRSAGYFAFNPQETGIPGVSPSGEGFASFLLGLADSTQGYFFNAPAYNRNGYWGAFAQDDYKLTKKLTLNLGVRWDLFQPTWDKYNRMSWVSPIVPNPGAGNLLGAMQYATPSERTGAKTYYNDVSPRIGLAYALNNKTVIRAGYGIFYGQGNAGQLFGGAFTQGWNGTIALSSPNDGLTPGFNWGTQTLPPFVPAFTPTEFNGDGTSCCSAGTLIEMDPSDGVSPYAQNYTLDIERQLPGQMMLSVAYVGNRGTHLPARLTPMDKLPPQYLPLGNTMVNVNGTPTSALLAPINNPAIQALPVVQAMPVDPATGDHSPFAGFEALYAASGNDTLGQSLRTTPQYIGWHRYYEGDGISDYNALQIQLQKRFSNGLTLLVSYAWSKTLTDAGSMFSTFSTEFGTTTPWNARDQYTYSFEDIPQNASIAYVYDLPVGQGRHFLNRGGVLNEVLGGWSVSGIQRYESGLPENITVPGYTNNWEDQGVGNVNRINGVPMASAAYQSGNFDPNVDSLFNPAAFATPAPWTFGTLTPTEATVRDFPYLNEEFSLLKAWTIKERYSLQFRADFYNAFNRAVFGSNNGAFTSEPVFGLPGFGMEQGQTNQPRTIQFGLRLNW